MNRKEKSRLIKKISVKLQNYSHNNECVDSDKCPHQCASKTFMFRMGHSLDLDTAIAWVAAQILSTSIYRCNTMQRKYDMIVVLYQIVDLHAVKYPDLLDLLREAAMVTMEEDNI